MPVNIPSLHAKLLNISRAQKIDLQLLLNRLASEQFLYRLSISPYAKKFIFKGGSLLTYLIKTSRKTRDLDFSIKQLNNQVDDIVKIIRSILEMEVDDGITWKKIDGAPLIHPEMDYPGVRIACHFLFGKMRGMVRLDLAIGDLVEPVAMTLERMRYKDKPIFGPSFSLLAYPSETIFAEKLQIIFKKQGRNTRMKDYYDLFLLIRQDLNRKNLKKCIQDVFYNRKTPFHNQIQFEQAEYAQLQTY